MGLILAFCLLELSPENWYLNNLFSFRFSGESGDCLWEGHCFCNAVYSYYFLAAHSQFWRRQVTDSFMSSSSPMTSKG